MDDIDTALITRLQRGMPVTVRPYQDIAGEFGLTEDELLARLANLLDRGVLTRFGPLFQVERMGGTYTLAAIQVPEHEYQRVTEIVNAHPQVAHNYRREHDFNMWFVVAAESVADVKRVLFEIERDSTHPVFEFPKLREYFVNLELPA